VEDGYAAQTSPLCVHLVKTKFFLISVKHKDNFTFFHITGWMTEVLAP
jgi:hypothetical protein